MPGMPKVRHLDLAWASRLLSALDLDAAHDGDAADSKVGRILLGRLCRGARLTTFSGDPFADALARASLTRRLLDTPHDGCSVDLHLSTIGKDDADLAAKCECFDFNDLARRQVGMGKVQGDFAEDGTCLDLVGPARG
jgi:hypothetical protein